MTFQGKFRDYLFTQNVVPVLKLLGFQIDLSQVKEHHRNWHINVGREQNWVATLKSDNSKLGTQSLIMAFYDGDFATDAFAVLNNFDDNSNPVILEMIDLDPTLFPSYDNPNYEHITITCDLRRKN